jgi:hypothetical protein
MGIEINKFLVNSALNNPPHNTSPEEPKVQSENVKPDYNATHRPNQESEVFKQDMIERKTMFAIQVEEKRVQVEEKRVHVEDMRADVETKRLENFNRKIALYEKMKMDDRDALNLKDSLINFDLIWKMPVLQQTSTMPMEEESDEASLNVAPQLSPPHDSTMPGIINVAQQPECRSAWITLSQWLERTGRPAMTKKQLPLFCGKTVIALYRARHGGSSPVKHSQQVNGVIRDVYSYTIEDDYDTIETAYITFMKI